LLLKRPAKGAKTRWQGRKEERNSTGAQTERTCPGAAASMLLRGRGLIFLSVMVTLPMEKELLLAAL
jgi:hypothetical protein